MTTLVLLKNKYDDKNLKTTHRSKNTGIVHTGGHDDTISQILSRSFLEGLKSEDESFSETDKHTDDD